VNIGKHTPLSEPAQAHGPLALVLRRLLSFECVTPRIKKAAFIMTEEPDPIDYPIDGTLDLHMFRSDETKEAVLEYLRVCLERHILAVRIVHGKGIGVQREIVQKLLAKHPNVVSFRHEEGSGGSWGATVVDLKE
jgi:dsDNA-specific endonuclease/ATPase MutS2